MYYKIIDKLPDEMQVYKETPLDMEHPAYGVDRRKIRTPWERDYFTIENGNIKLISGRPDKTEFDGVKVEYPKGTKEICLFVEKNRDSLLPMVSLIAKNGFYEINETNYFFKKCESEI